MRLFYDRCPIEKRPKIFGMTASPVNSLASVESSVRYAMTTINVYYSLLRSKSYSAVVVIWKRIWMLEFIQPQI